MKNSIFIAMLYIFTASCSQKETASAAYEDDVYAVINFCLSSNDIAANDKALLDGFGPPKHLSPDEPVSIKGMDSLFTKDDSAYLQEQLKDTAAFTIKQERLTRAIHLIDMEKLDRMFSNNTKTEEIDVFYDMLRDKYNRAYCTFSRPLFSKNRQAAVIYYSYYCGLMCAHCTAYLLQKVNGKWTLVTTTEQWIS